MTAAAVPEKASEALRNFLDSVMPPDPRQAIMDKIHKARQASDIENMGPISAKSIRLGAPMTNLPTSSMAKPSDMAHLNKLRKDDLASAKP